MKNTLEINAQNIFDYFATIYDLQNSATDTKAVCGFQVAFDVTVKKSNNQSEVFLIIYHTVERNDGLMAYNGYEMQAAGYYDESQELLEFADYDETLLYPLERIAEDACKDYLNNHSDED